MHKLKILRPLITQAMKDISQQIKNAINYNSPRAISDFFHANDLLKKSGYEVSHWLNEENWATILLNGSPTGYLCKKYPVLLVLTSYSDEVNKGLSELPFISSVEVNDLEKEELKLDHAALNAYFEFGLNFEKFSATDLWFHTNSI